MLVTPVEFKVSSLTIATLYYCRSSRSHLMAQCCMVASTSSSDIWWNWFWTFCFWRAKSRRAVRLIKARRTIFLKMVLLTLISRAVRLFGSPTPKMNKITLNDRLAQYTKISTMTRGIKQFAKVQPLWSVIRCALTVIIQNSLSKTLLAHATHAPFPV